MPSPLATQTQTTDPEVARLLEQVGLGPTRVQSEGGSWVKVNEWADIDLEDFLDPEALPCWRCGNPGHYRVCYGVDGLGENRRYQFASYCQECYALQKKITPLNGSPLNSLQKESLEDKK